MKLYILFALFCCPLLRDAVHAQSDYVVTWQNDTIFCRFPDKPGKEGFKPAWKYKNGHIQLAAVFSNDSVRMISAGEIKSYSRAKHGQSLLCNGNFESIQLVNRDSTLTEEEGKREKNWFFLNKIVPGKYATLYCKYLFTSRGPRIYYYLVKHTRESNQVPQLVWDWKKTKSMLADEDIADKLRQFRFTKARNKYRELVREYNRLKEEAALGKTQ